jgi:hypothetical protein
MILLGLVRKDEKRDSIPLAEPRPHPGVGAELATQPAQLPARHTPEAIFSITK